MTFTVITALPPKKRRMKHTRTNCNGGEGKEPDMTVKKGNVIRSKVTGRKKMVWDDGVVSDADWEKVCDRPHEDGDFSYLCGSDYCRCCQ